MLVIGGVSSLWGAVVGAVGVSLLNSFLSHAENGTSGVPPERDHGRAGMSLDRLVSLVRRLPRLGRPANTV
jgi:ABC-type branched-subunit amino acid transport system permease subunit